MATLITLMSWLVLADPVASSSFACNVSTLVSGQRCVFDGEAPGKAEAGQSASQVAQKNVETAGGLANPICDEVLRHSASAKDVLRSQCRDRVARAAKQCQAGGRRVLDSSGRFTDDGRDCYRALRNAQVEVEMAAAEVVPCCECLVKSGCARSLEVCASSTPSAAGKCGASCSDVCAMPDPPAEVPKS